MRALNNSVVVRPVSEGDQQGEQKRASGIFVPGTTVAKNNEGIVVEVGPGRWQNGQRVPIELKPGDRILYLRSFAYEIFINGKRVFKIEEDHVVFVLDDDENADFVGDTADAQERTEALGAGV